LLIATGDFVVDYPVFWLRLLDNESPSCYPVGVNEMQIQPNTSLRVADSSNPPPDIVQMLLADKRSENTRRAYRHDLTHFFVNVFGAEPSPDSVAEFLAQSTSEMTVPILRYKALLIEKGSSESTINRRMAAILSLVKMARRIGMTDADPRGNIDSEKVVTYRDTRGITLAQVRSLLAVPDRTMVQGKRDYALLLLLVENALRRNEVVGLCISDFSAEEWSLLIAGKGMGSQKTRITISTNAATAIADYLSARGDCLPSKAPLFTRTRTTNESLHLTADGLYKIIGELAKQAGLSARLSPHRLRHTAITLALDIADGDIRKVQRLSRHARLETLLIYDDNRTNFQGEMTDRLSALVGTAATVRDAAQ